MGEWRRERQDYSLCEFNETLYVSYYFYYYYYYYYFLDIVAILGVGEKLLYSHERIFP